MLVSVIIPTYNRADRIRGAVESALAQSYRDLEVIVVDDGSTDSTMDVLAEYVDRVLVISQPNAGPSAARNRGATAAKGGILAFLDSDDRWAVNKIKRQVGLILRGGSQMCCCVCNASVIGVTGNPIGQTFDSAGIRPDFPEGEWTNPQDILATRFLLFNQVVAIRREAFAKVGGFNEDLWLLEDYELALRLSSSGTWGVIREPLVIKHNDTIGIGVKCMMNRERHAQVRVEILAGILGTPHDLGPRAQLNLERTLASLKAELRALAMEKRGGFLSVACGKALGLCLRARWAARRRSPSWPQFQGRALEV